MSDRVKEIVEKYAHKYFSYDKDSGLLTRIHKPVKSNQAKIGDVVGSKANGGYLNTIIHGVPVYIHKIAWYMHYGEYPEFMVNHINHDKSDNRIDNLIRGTSTRMNIEMHSNNTSGTTGVNKGKDGLWVVRYGHMKRRYFLGVYKSKSQAINARNLAKQWFDEVYEHGMQLLAGKKLVAQMAEDLNYE